jgi:hypothetical protein
MTNQINYAKLILSLLFDAIGMLSFAIPGIGEFSDVIWAPLSYWLMTRMYPGRIGQVGGLISFVEEALPGVDFIPTFTLTWLYDTFYAQKNTSS